MSTIEAFGVFVLAAMPGVVTVELLKYGRPPLRRREAGATLALYILFSALAWAAALGFLDAEPRLVALVELDDEQAIQLVDQFVPLAATVLGAAVALGVVLRAFVVAKDRFAEDLYRRLIESERGLVRWLARPLAAGILAHHAWDRLLARVQRTRRAQLVRVRLRDGGEVYGVFAGAGRADYDADGRGLLLDRELVAVGGELVEVGAGSGVFIHPDAIATVSFVERPSSDGPRSSVE